MKIKYMLMGCLILLSISLIAKESISIEDRQKQEAIEVSEMMKLNSLNPNFTMISIQCYHALAAVHKRIGKKIHSFSRASCRANEKNNIVKIRLIASSHSALGGASLYRLDLSSLDNILILNIEHER